MQSPGIPDLQTQQASALRAQANNTTMVANHAVGNPPVSRLGHLSSGPMSNASKGER